MEIDYTVQIWRERGQFVAQAIPLDLASSGATAMEARTALDEAVELFLTTAREAGTLEQLLEECGYELNQGKWLAPEWISVEQHSTRLSA